MRRLLCEEGEDRRIRCLVESTAALFGATVSFCCQSLIAKEHINFSSRTGEDLAVPFSTFLKRLNSTKKRPVHCHVCCDSVFVAVLKMCFICLCMFPVTRWRIIDELCCFPSITQIKTLFYTLNPLITLKLRFKPAYMLPLTKLFSSFKSNCF